MSKKTYELNEKQRAVWRERLPEMRRGLPTEIANEFVRQEGGKLGSRKTQLSAFLKGEAPGLRAVFANKVRVALVAKKLGWTEGELRQALQFARGEPELDSWDQVRIPGFEDHHPVPILEGFLPPWLSQQKIHLWSLKDLSTSGGGLFDPEEVARRVLRAVGVPRAVIITGPKGSGRHAAARALAERFRNSGLSVTDNPAGWLGEGVVLAGNISNTPAGLRQAMFSAAAQGKGIVAGVAALGDDLADLPTDVVLVQLSAGMPHWADQTLAKLQVILLSHLGKNVDLKPVRQWLLDDPTAAAFAHRVDVLGLVARAVLEGASTPVGMDQLLALTIRHWSSVLRRADLPGPAVLFEHFGADELGDALAQSILTGSDGAAPVSFARGVAQRAVLGFPDRSTEPTQESLTSILQAIHVLEEERVVGRADGRITLHSALVGAAAVGHWLATTDEIEHVLEGVVLNTGWHSALVAAAEHTRDVAPLLRAIDCLPAAVRCQAIPATTMLLGAAVPCSDHVLLRQHFVRCLYWWSRVRPRQTKVTLSLGGRLASASPPVDEARINGTAALVVLGQISRARCEEIGGDILIETVTDDVADAHLRVLLEALGCQSVTRQQAIDALVVGAPFQTRHITNPQMWKRLPTAFRKECEEPPRHTSEDHDLWWRTTGAPRLLDEPRGFRLIAGIDVDWDPRHGLWQPESGRRLWVDSFESAFVQDRESSAISLAGVINAALGGGSWAFAAVSSLWQRLTPGMKAGVRDAFAASQPPVTDWRALPDDIGWLLRSVLSQPVVSALWVEWSSGDRDAVSCLPWHGFLDAGVPVLDIVGWATKRAQTGGERAPVAEPLKVSGDGSLFMLPPARPSVHEAILDWALKGVDEAVLTRLIFAPNPWGEAAWKRLEDDFPVVWRSLRITAAGKFDRPARLQLLQHMVPRIGEEDGWLHVYFAADSVGEQIVRVAQVCASREPSQRAWRPLTGALTLLETALHGDVPKFVPGDLVVGRDSRLDAFLVGPPLAVDQVPDEDTAALYVAARRDVFVSLPVVLESASAGHAPWVSAIVDRTMSSSRLSREALSFHPQGWLALVRRDGGDTRVAEVLAMDAQLSDEPGRLKQILTNSMDPSQLSQLILPHIGHETLGPVVVKVLSERVGTGAPDVLEAVLDSLSITAWRGYPLEFGALLLTLAIRRPLGAVRRLQDFVGTSGKDEYRDLCLAMLRVLRTGRERTTVLAMLSAST